MTVVIGTDYGEVEVTFYTEPGQPWGGALVHAPALQIGDLICVARLYLARDGSAKHQVGTLPEDDDAFDITIPTVDDTDHAVTKTYLNGPAREHALLILRQAFAEATYLPEFQQAQRHAKGRELAKALRERNNVNTILDRAIQELVSLDVLAPDASLHDLPDYFCSPEQHNEDMKERESLRVHLKMFAWNQVEQAVVDDPDSPLDELEYLHIKKCPLARQ